MIPFNTELKDALNNIPEIRKMYETDREIKRVIDYSLKLEGKVRHASVHAAGVVISKDVLSDEIPTYSDGKTKIVSTQYQMKELEELGILKMDFLGLKNLTILRKTVENIEKRQKTKIVLNDIQEGVNNKASEIYEEISIQNNQFKERLEKLKRDYLLSEEALSDISLCDSVEEVFKKAYAYDAKIMAKESAAYENGVQGLNSLDPTSDDYQNELSVVVDQLVESLPIQNRATLSKYVARRKMVIELMDKILNRMLICQDNSKRNEDEKLLHNLIFKQHSDNPLTSDLWLINEEYMYYKGTSESVLSKVELDGEKIFKDEFEEEERRYLTSLGENRERLRTDVLLFPSEGKCVIIEFKNPNVNLADCLTQVSKYAYFLRNFTKPEYKFLTFYGYLIGESLEKRDIRAADGDFKTAPNLDYLFRPMKTVPDDSGTNQDGSLYMEVIQFSVLKERAELRNRAFIDCLIGNGIKNTSEDSD